MSSGTHFCLLPLRLFDELTSSSLSLEQVVSFWFCVGGGETGNCFLGKSVRCWCCCVGGGVLRETGGRTLEI